MTLPWKLYITNTAGACFLIWAFWIGYAQRVTSADVAHMWAVIGTMFLYGVISTFRLSFALEKSRSGAGQNAKQLLVRGEHLGTIVSALFILGIVGNAIGILSGFGGIDLNALDSADGIRKLSVQVLSGATTTFGSTIVGATLALWTMCNAQMLWTETALLALESADA
jgi:hypothetical protein